MKYPTSPLTPFFAALPQNSLHRLLAHSRVSRTAQALSDRVSMACALLNSLVALFLTPVVCFQELARSFAKTPGVVYYPPISNDSRRLGFRGTVETVP